MTVTVARSVAVQLNQNLRERIERLADTRHCTTHGMLHEAIQQYVEREEQREAFRRDGTRAWNEYQASGLHVTWEEADVWLAKLESGQDAEPPECHV